MNLNLDFIWKKNRLITKQNKYNQYAFWELVEPLPVDRWAWFQKRFRIYSVVFFIFIIYTAEVYSINKQISESKHAITYSPHSGRLGDQICGYARTKWLSYKYKLPFIFNPIVPGHSEMPDLFQKLNMFHLETHAGRELIESIQKKQIINNYEPYLSVLVVENESDLALALNKKIPPTLFICSYSTKLDLTNTTMFKNKIAYTKQNADLLTYLTSIEKRFGNELKRMLAPVNTSSQVLPKDRITVAVHIRTGGGYDKVSIYKQYFDCKKYPTFYRIIQIDDEQIKFDENNSIIATNESSIKAKGLLRFIPKQYYVDQIKKLSNLLNNIPLYVYLFTDEKDVVLLVDEFRKKVNMSNIEWDCRASGNVYFRNIVEDFYFMSQFDCLIRAQSNFSLSASLLGNHKIIIQPRHGRIIKEDILLIDQVDIIYRDKIINTINSISNKVN